MEHRSRNQRNKNYRPMKNHREQPSDGPRKKKKFGQHFLRKQSVVDHMIERVSITPETTVMEIGCGDGFLTQSILHQTPCKNLLVYEIDPEWLHFVKEHIRDPRLHLDLKNILELDCETELKDHQPLVLLANLPYQVTFPILFLIQNHKHLFQEGVVMVQEEVAYKITASSGRGFSSTSLFLQHHFKWQLMERIEPGAFTPPPKINSRLLYFKPRFDQPTIPNEAAFWKFLKLCFNTPRQTLKNNLRTTHYPYQRLSEETLGLRAQQLSFDEFLTIWQLLMP